MIDKTVLMKWIVDALVGLNNEGSIVEVSKHIWNNHEAELRRSGDLFYTWQYDIRWAKQALANMGVLEEAKRSGKGNWVLKIV
jgi:GH15 family glucan-1,4-alpha-glucosidase